MQKRSAKRSRKEPDLEFIFHPRTIAVVGASNDPANYFGYLYMIALSHFGQNLYPVNPRQTEIHGRTVYSRIGDIPGAVDYVIGSPTQEKPGDQEEFAEGLIEAAKTIDKPIAVCIISSGISQLSGSYYGLHEQCVKAGFPVYPTVERAAQAMSHFIRYHENRKKYRTSIRL